MAMYMLCLTFLVKGVSTVFCFLSWRLYNSKAKMGIQAVKSDMALDEKATETATVMATETV